MTTLEADMTTPIRPYMSVSLDGVNGQVYAEALDPGAVISGRRTFELAGRPAPRRRPPRPGGDR